MHSAGARSDPSAGSKTATPGRCNPQARLHRPFLPTVLAEILLSVGFAFLRLCRLMARVSASTADLRMGLLGHSQVLLQGGKRLGREVLHVGVFAGIGFLLELGDVLF